MVPAGKRGLDEGGGIHRVLLLCCCVHPLER
jgi:hypothetical protein